MYVAIGDDFRSGEENIMAPFHCYILLKLLFLGVFAI